MAKRRLSLSPEHDGHSPYTPEPKKRKIGDPASNEPSSSNTTDTRVAHSPAPVASDSSATLDGDEPSSPQLAPSKDKGKAVEKDPAVLELERLREEVAQKNALLEKADKSNAAILQALTCHVCLEVVCVPYALVPCGHMACHACLVRWFTSTHNDHDNDEQNPHIEWFSDEESDPGAGGPDAEAGPSGSGTAANVPSGSGHIQDTLHLSGNGLPPPTHALPPGHAPFPNSENRMKTCPHCRGTVRQRPIPAYAIRDILGIVGPPCSIPAPEAEQDQKDVNGKKKPKRDPWKGVFPPDDGHGGGGFPPWHGFGGMGPGGQPPDGPNDTAPVPPDVLDGSDYEYAHDDEPHEPLQNPAPSTPPPPPILDEEDGVRRCGECLHELWQGACTNCDVVYPELVDNSDDGVGSVDEEVLREDGDNIDREHMYDPVDPYVEEGYESSFIDDEDDDAEVMGRARLIRGEANSSDVEYDGDDFLPGPSRRYTGREEPIIISSDNDEDESPGSSRIIGNSRIRRIPALVDADDEEGDVRSVVNSLTTSGSGHEFVWEHEFTEPSGVPYIEPDNEGDGNVEVPYIWEAQDENDSDGDEGEGEEDNVVDDTYISEDDEDDDGNRDGYES